jgi:hypothetical protein
MLCEDLTATWIGLREWFDERDVLVLPRLTGVGASVRLDGDVATERAATHPEISMVIDRLHKVIERYGIPAVYVGRVGSEPSGELATVTIRALACGVVHELTLVSAGYAVPDIDLDRTLFPVGMPS